MSNYRYATYTIGIPIGMLLNHFEYLLVTALFIRVYKFWVI